MAELKISHSVGSNSRNEPSDVVVVQTMLTHFIAIGRFKHPGVVIDGKCGPKTKEAITNFQFQNGLISQEHFENRITTNGPTMEFFRKKAGGIPERLKKQKLEEDFKSQISSIDCSRYESKPQFVREFSIFKRIFLLALDGVDVDDSYYTFTPKDVLGTTNYKNPQWLVFDGMRHAFRQTRIEFEGFGDRDRTAIAAYRSYYTLSNHTDWLFKWQHVAGVTGDASISGYTEMGYFRDVIRRLSRTQPISIYHAVGKRFVDGFNIILPMSPHVQGILRGL